MRFIIVAIIYEITNLIVFIKVAVSAVQMENKKLKAELAELLKMKDLIDRDYSQKRSHGIIDRERIKERERDKTRDRERESERGKRDVSRRVGREDKEIDVRGLRGDDAGCEGKEVRGIEITTAELHLVSPATPISFVSRAICQIESKSPLPVRLVSHILQKLLM